MANILIYAEHSHGKLPKAVAVAVSAAKEISAKHGGGDLILAVLGSGVGEVAKAAAALGASKVVTIDSPALAHANADVVTIALKAAAEATGSSTVVFASTSDGKDIAPRLAGAMDAAIAPEITAVNADGTFTRPMVAGNLFATVQLAGDKKVVTVRTTAFDAAAAGGAAPVEALSVAVTPPANAAKFVSVEETKSDRPVLTEASRVVAGGRGLKSGEKDRKSVV